MLPKQDFRITEVRIENFRSLTDIWVPLRRQTVLIGENNSGKTAFLDAIAMAFSESSRYLSEDDVFLNANENQVPRDRKIIVDIRIEPGDENDVEFTDEVRNLFADAIRIGKTGERDFIALRTEYAWDKTREEYSRSRFFLSAWANTKPDAEKLQTLIRPTPRRDLMEHFPFYYLDAKRDILEQLRARRSFWGKLASDLKLPDKAQKKVQQTLKDINNLLCRSSPVLKHLKDRLNELYRTVASDRESVEITPLPQQLNDLVFAMDLLFKTQDAQAFSISRHGMGTRSMAVLLVFRAFIEWQEQRKKSIASLPIVALEEPEAHLHPHAQRALFDQIAELSGHKLVSTHSPHVVSHAELFDFILFRKSGSKTKITWIPEKNTDGTPFLDTESAHKVHRFVQLENNELFFSKIFILFEGMTEQFALPIFAKAYFKQNPDSLGISFVPVDGVGNYDPFLKIAEVIRIPWVILSDAEPDPLKKLEQCFKRAGLDPAKFDDQTIKLPDGNDFERYLIDEGYVAEIEDVITEHFGSKALQKFKDDRQGVKNKKGNIYDYSGNNGHLDALNDFIDKYGKTFFGRYLAEKIVENRNDESQIPPKVRELFTAIEKLCKQVY